MAKYTKKPVTIDAVQFLGFMKVDDTRTDTLFSAYPEWLMKALRGGLIQYIDPNVLAVNTLEGRMIISKDDFVVMGIKGEIYPCKPDIFLEIYQEVY